RRRASGTATRPSKSRDHGGARDGVGPLRQAQPLGFVVVPPSRAASIPTEPSLAASLPLSATGESIPMSVATSITSVADASVAASPIASLPASGAIAPGTQKRPRDVPVALDVTSVHASPAAQAPSSPHGTAHAHAPPLRTQLAPDAQIGGMPDAGSLSETPS